MPDTKSILITNAEAGPVIFSPALTAGGRLRETAVVVEVAAADADGKVLRLCRVHSSWRISQIMVANDAITAGTAYDLGLYNIEDGAAVDDDLFASAVDLSSASGYRDLAYEAAATAIDKAEKPLWQRIANVTEDPGIYYDLCLTADTVGSADGTIAVLVRYTDWT